MLWTIWGPICTWCEVDAEEEVIEGEVGVGSAEIKPRDEFEGCWAGSWRQHG